MLYLNEVSKQIYSEPSSQEARLNHLNNCQTVK